MNPTQIELDQNPHRCRGGPRSGAVEVPMLLFIQAIISRTCFELLALPSRYCIEDVYRLLVISGPDALTSTISVREFRTGLSLRLVTPKCRTHNFKHFPRLERLHQFRNPPASWLGRWDGAFVPTSSPRFLVCASSGRSFYLFRSTSPPARGRTHPVNTFFGK